MTKIPFLAGFAAWVEKFLFATKRLDYYQYLSALLQGYDGRKTLKDIFLQDAQRYGQKTLRGRLSMCWLKKFQSSGGDLYATWHGHLPHAELSLIRSAQELGNQAVVQTLDNLALVLNLLNDCKRILQSVLLPALLTILLLAAVCMAIPWFTVPKLMQTFSEVPPNYYGSLTSKLLYFSNLIKTYYVLIGLMLLAVVVFVAWSFDNLTGRIRNILDKYFLWNIYRNISALQFFMLLGVALGQDKQSNTPLKSALLIQRLGACAWLNVHINVMLNQIELGHTGAKTFDTGLLQKTQYWFFYDMVLARGLRTAIELVCNSLHKHILMNLTRQVNVYKWLLLLFSVASILTIALWHYAVIEELRRSLTFVFS